MLFDPLRPLERIRRIVSNNLDLYGAADSRFDVSAKFAAQIYIDAIAEPRARTATTFQRLETREFINDITYAFALLRWYDKLAVNLMCVYIELAERYSNRCATSSV